MYSQQSLNCPFPQFQISGMPFSEEIHTKIFLNFLSRVTENAQIPRRQDVLSACCTSDFTCALCVMWCCSDFKFIGAAWLPPCQCERWVVNDNKKQVCSSTSGGLGQNRDLLESLAVPLTGLCYFCTVLSCFTWSVCGNYSVGR